MSEIIKQWLLFKYINSEFHSAFEAFQDKGASGEGSREIPGA